MPFIPKLTSKLGEVIKSVNMNPVFYPYSKIRSLFPNGKDSTPPLAKSGGYLLRGIAPPFMLEKPGVVFRQDSVTICPPL